MRKSLLRSAFSTTEIMVVMLIIAMLITLAVPNYKSHRLRALDTASLTDMREFVTLLESSYADLEEYPEGECVNYDECFDLLPEGALPEKMHPGTRLHYTGYLTTFALRAFNIAGDNMKTFIFQYCKDENPLLDENGCHERDDYRYGSYMKVPIDPSKPIQ